MLKADQKQSKVQASGLWLNQLRNLVPVMLLIYAPVLVIFMLLKLQNRIPVASLTRDPLAIAEGHFYWGTLSNIGILLWCSTVAICLFSAWLIREIERKKEFRQFFQFSSFVTSVLLFDDFFLLHEEAFPNYLGIAENSVYLGYGIIILLYLVKCRKTILKTDFILLLLAFGFFGLSVVSDSFPTVTGLLGKDGEVILEDGLKQMGIVSWFTYFARTCAIQLKQAITLRLATADSYSDHSL